MIVFAAHVPHTPLMLPAIGKEHRKRLRDTLDGMERLEEELYASQPDVIVLISSHSIQHDTTFSINLHDEFIVDLKEFGDLTTANTFEPDLDLIDKIQRSLRRGQQPLTLDSDAVLDYGCAVPLVLLSEHLPNVKILPISFSGLGPKEHHTFGRMLKDVLAVSNKRVAVISSGDLSHCLSTTAPGGFKKEGEEFDSYVTKAVEQASASNLLTLEPEFVQIASECAYRPLLIMFGILDGIQVAPEILSYEAPFGVGYLVAQFHLI
jgi:aromatic ring-opening dioxygenase LigB subunit